MLRPQSGSSVKMSGAESTSLMFSAEIKLNEIGRISFRSTMPLFVDEYRRNRQTGSFVLIDEASNATVAAGMILGETAG